MFCAGFNGLEAWTSLEFLVQDWPSFLCKERGDSSPWVARYGFLREKSRSFLAKKFHKVVSTTVISLARM